MAWLNTESDVHPVLVSGVAQFQLVHIHPFVDGNGRTSRLLSTLCLYRAGYDFKRHFSVSEYYDRNRTGFYTALQSVREHEMDLTGWLDYFVEGRPHRWTGDGRASNSPRWVAVNMLSIRDGASRDPPGKG